MRHSLFSVQPKKGVIASWYQSVFCCCFSVVLNGCFTPQNYVSGLNNYGKYKCTLIHNNKQFYIGEHAEASEINSSQ